MKLKLALLVGLLLSTNAVMAFDAAGIEPPLLTDGHQNSSGKGCSAIRARKPAELPQPWRSAVTQIVMTCEPMEGVDKEPDASTHTVAVLRPVAVSLRGIPVVELRHGASWAGDDVQHVLDAPYAKVAQTIAAYVRARCSAAFGPAARIGDTCDPVFDSGDGGFFVKTSETGGTYFHPDPDNPRRSILAVAWSE